MTPLFDEMRAQIHATPMPAPAPRSRWGARRRTGLISGGALALAAVAAAVVVIVSSGSGAPPAYAAVFHTSRTGQRTVTITLRQWRDISRLNALLAGKHTRIRVVRIVRGCAAPVHVVIGAYRGVPAHIAPGPARTLEVDRIAPVVPETISVDTLPGRTLIFPVTRSGMLGDTLGPGDGVVVGPAPQCVGISPRFKLPS